MAFIDGDHTYAGVSKDIRNLLPLLEAGGSLCFHDYSSAFPGVVQAVNELVAEPGLIDRTYLVKSLFVARKRIAAASSAEQEAGPKRPCSGGMA
jgi:hypothetical protein